MNHLFRQCELQCLQIFAILQLVDIELRGSIMGEQVVSLGVFDVKKIFAANEQVPVVDLCLRASPCQLMATCSLLVSLAALWLTG